MNMQDMLSQATPLSLAGPIARTSSLDGASIDLLNYEGIGAFLLNAAAATAGTTPTLNCKLQESDDDSTFTDVTDGAYDEVTDVAGTAGLQLLKLNVSNLKRYVKLIGTIAGDSASFDFTAEFLGFKKAS